MNALTPPMPTAKRCFAFGQFLGRCTRKNSKRIAVIATGGLSHWPGEAKHGKINIPFDKKFLRNVDRRRPREIERNTHEEIKPEAGSGGHEIRTWIALAGAVAKLESGTDCLRAGRALGDRLRLGRHSPAESIGRSMLRPYWLSAHEIQPAQPPRRRQEHR